MDMSEVRAAGQTKEQKGNAQGEVTWEEYRDAAWLSRGGIRKAKVQLEISLLRGAKNKKGFYRYVNQKRKFKGSNTGKLVSVNKWKAEELNFFTSVFTGNLSSHISQVVESRMGTGGAKSCHCKERLVSEEPKSM